jgi:MoaA/NifB/PqqE/SkfB family radical SAM enzyme
MSILKNKFYYQLKNMSNFLFFFFNKKKIIKSLNKNIPYLSIETTNICNANCIFCAYQFQLRPTGIMSMDLFKKIVREYAEHNTGNVNLTPTVGEPLADKHLIERIKYLRSFSNINKIGFYSNLISLSNFNLKEIIMSGINSLAVSTSGFDEDMYKRIYRSVQYKKMYKNLSDLIQINNENENPIDITIDMRSDLSLSETLKLNDYKKLLNYISPSKFFYKFYYDNWAGKIKKENLIGSMKLRKKLNLNLNHIRISPCSEFYSGPHIYWDGRVGICGCRDVDAKELIIGDAREANINEIWFGKNREYLLKQFMSNPKDICKNCSHYNNLSVFNHISQKSIN